MNNVIASEDFFFKRKAINQIIAEFIHELDPMKKRIDEIIFVFFYFYIIFKIFKFLNESPHIFDDNEILTLFV